MKTLIFIASLIGFGTPKQYTSVSILTPQERRFVRNVIRTCGTEPAEVYRLPNGKIQVNYPDQRLTLGQDGFIHDYEILEKGEWIDLGPEY